MIHTSIVAGWLLAAKSLKDPAGCFGGADVAGKVFNDSPILLPSQGSAPPKQLAGFFFGATAMGALVNGPAWANSHENTGHSTPECEPSDLSARDRASLGVQRWDKPLNDESQPQGLSGIGLAVKARYGAGWIVLSTLGRTMSETTEEIGGGMFADFWAMYPRKVAKRVAEKTWSKLTPEEQRAAVIALPDHIRYWRQTDRDEELIPHASTWLNQGRWEDELPRIAKQNHKTNGVLAELTGGSNVVVMRVG